MSDWYIEHSAKGSTWKKHRYLSKVNVGGSLRYIYTKGASKSNLTSNMKRINTSNVSIKRAVSRNSAAKEPTQMLRLKASSSFLEAAKKEVKSINIGSSVARMKASEGLKSISQVLKKSTLLRRKV